MRILMVRVIRIIVLVMAFRGRARQVRLLHRAAGGRHRCGGHRRRLRAPGRARQPHGGPDHHLHQAVPGRRVHRDQQRARRRDGDRALDHHPGPDRPLARHRAEPEDRRRDLAQLRHHAAADPDHARAAQRGPQRGIPGGRARWRRRTRACSRIRRRAWASTRSTTTASRSRSGRGSAVVDVFSAEPDLYQALVEAFRARGIGTPAASHQVRLLEAAGAR